MEVRGLSKTIYEEIILEMNKSLSKQVPYNIELKQNHSTNNENILGANINIVGEEYCEFYIFGKKELFFEIAKKNYGFEVPDDVLPSFVGEFWNYVLGPIIKEIKKMGVEIDISHSIPLKKEEKPKEFTKEIVYKVSEENEKEIGYLTIYVVEDKKGEI